MAEKVAIVSAAGVSRVRSSSLQARRRLRGSLRVWGILLVLASLALEAGGCGNWFRPVEWSELGPRSEQKSPFRVIARKNMEVAALNPDDIVRVMERVGFADEQILELGTDLHNALRFSGAAAITYKKDTLAVFMIESDYLRIRSQAGAFDYQISKGQFVQSAMKGRQ